MSTKPHLIDLCTQLDDLLERMKDQNPPWRDAALVCPSNQEDLLFQQAYEVFQLVVSRLPHWLIEVELPTGATFRHPSPGVDPAHAVKWAAMAMDVENIPYKNVRIAL